MRRVLIVCPKEQCAAISRGLAAYSNYELLFDAIEDIRAQGVVAYTKQRIETLRSGVLRVDGIVGVNEMSCTIASIIANAVGLTGPTLEAVLGCQNKYISRQRQQNAVPAHIPSFCLAKEYLARSVLEQSYPRFTKPVRSRLSFGAHIVNSAQHMQATLERWQAHVERENKDYAALMAHFGVDHEHLHTYNEFLCEELLVGRQVTLDGYVFEGAIHFFGVTASIFHPNTISFVRFDYPYSFDPILEDQVRHVAQLLVDELKLNNTLFNIEFKIDEDRQKVFVIEIHARLSFQFSSLIEKVTGYSPLHAMCAIACGIDPQQEARCAQPTFPLCSICVLRTEQNSRVLRRPSAQELDVVARQFPEVEVTVLVEAGKLLSDYIQDAHTFRYAFCSIPGADARDIARKRHAIEALLPFEFEPVAAPGV